MTRVLYLRSWRVTLSAASSMAENMSSELATTRTTLSRTKTVTSQALRSGLEGFLSTLRTTSQVMGLMSNTLRALPTFSSTCSRSESDTPTLRPEILMSTMRSSFAVGTHRGPRAAPALGHSYPLGRRSLREGPERANLLGGRLRVGLGRGVGGGSLGARDQA